MAEERGSPAPARSNSDILKELNISDEDRFQMELEFVQCLANPEYLTWLAQTHDIESPKFLAFLDYLQYWRRPEYSHHITCVFHSFPITCPCP